MIRFLDKLNEAKIGIVLGQNRLRLFLSLFIALSAVGADLWLVSRGFDGLLYRFWIPIVALLILAKNCKWNWKCLGLTLKPIPSWMYWFKITLFLALIVGGITIGGHLLLKYYGIKINIAWTFKDLTSFLKWILIMGVAYPILEEFLYRLVFCASVSAAVGPRLTIILNGVVFGLLHYLYGVAAPENIIGGFILSWAYFRSGTIIIPIILHCFGNIAISFIHL